MPKIDFVRYDVNMADKLISDGRKLRWYGVDEAPFRLGGLPFRRAGGKFRRLPELPSGVIPEAVDVLAWHTAGATLAFRTDSDCVCVRAKIHSEAKVDHMTTICSCGFDLYIGVPGRREFCGVTRFPHELLEYSVILADGLPGDVREFLLHFPLYGGVESLEIGLSDGARIFAPAPWSADGKIVIYGTSVTQGGCASRPGLCTTAILSRRLNREIVNLGFSGSGCGEPEVLELVAQVPNPELIVLDYAQNSGLSGLKKTLPGAVDILRRRHPDTPIALMTPTHIIAEQLCAKRAGEMNEFHEVMRAEVARRRAAGDAGIHLVNGTVEGADWFDCTVDGVHPTDLGFWRQAELVGPQLERLL